MKKIGLLTTGGGKKMHVGALLLPIVFVGLSTVALPFNCAQDYTVMISTVAVLSKGELTVKDQFRTGEKVQVEVSIKNLSAETLNVPKGEDYYRPQLLRDGQLLSYRKEVSERIKEQDKGNWFRITGFLFLKPSELQTDLIDLDYWYGPLEAGQYQLSLQRLFFKQRTDSNTAFFEIMP